MRYIEWLFLLVLGAGGTGLANWIGYDVGFLESLPGLIVLVAISMLAVVCVKVIPLKLPIVAYCAIIGLLLACPLSPIRGFVIDAAAKINFTAPFAMVGAYAGLGDRRSVENIYQARTEDSGSRSACDDGNVSRVLPVGYADADVVPVDLSER